MADRPVARRRCLDCGAELRSGNTGGRCGACDRRQASEPPVPADFWYLPEVSAALAQWDLATVVRLAHRKLGLSQVAISDLTGYSQAHISRMLHRSRPIEGVTLPRLRQFVEGLDIPWRLVGLVDPSLRESPGGDTSRSVNSSIAGEDDAVRRRTLITKGPLALGAGALGTMAADGLWSGGRFGSSHVKQLHRTARQLLDQDFRYGGDNLFTQAATQFEIAHAQIKAGNYDPALEQRVFGAIGDLARCAGWLAHDAGLNRQARYYFNEALLAARLSGNRQLATSTYYSMSVQADENGHPREAMHLARAAKRSATGWAPGRVVSVLLAAEARAWAGMADEHETMTLLALARAEYEGSRSDDFAELLSFFDEVELLGFQGLCLLKLGAYQQAEALLRQAADHGPAYQRNNTLDTARVALAQAGQHNVVDAAESGIRVLDALGSEILSTRIVKVVQQLDQQLRPYSHVTVVGAFQNHLADRLAEQGRT